jgi:hypothetical protein
LKKDTIVIGSIIGPGEGVGPSRELFSVLDIVFSANDRNIKFAVVWGNSPENEFIVALRVVFIFELCEIVLSVVINWLL